MANTYHLYKELDSDSTPSLDNDFELVQPQLPTRLRITTIVLSISTLVFALLSIYLSYVVHSLRVATQHPSSLRIFQDGYDTELTPPKSAIEIQTVMYSSPLEYNATSRTYYRQIDPTTPKYVGEPSPEIDENWLDLLAGEYLVFNEEEAAADFDNPEKIQGYYFGEVEVLHSLHCLNSIRKQLHPDYYENHDTHHSLPKSLRDAHIDHCIEQLRQSIQCAVDLTPVPLRPFGEGKNVTLIGNGQLHTCRNWDAFRTWWTERGHRNGSIEGVDS